MAEEEPRDHAADQRAAPTEQDRRPDRHRIGSRQRESRQCADDEARDDDGENEEHELDPVEELALLRLELLVGEDTFVVQLRELADLLVDLVDVRL